MNRDHYQKKFQEHYNKAETRYMLPRVTIPVTPPPEYHRQELQVHQLEMKSQNEELLQANLSVA